ncbi:hypothetical protein HDU82_006092 [Entophlyctis luteolus]|nr:hypothetical protein HDU82_006092 [Entophlyctis luteolus]
MELFAAAHLTHIHAHDAAARRSLEMPARDGDPLQPAEPCVCLHFRYYPADAQFFPESLPVELAGLIPAAEFMSRIRGINLRLAKYRWHEDHGPIVRGAIMVAYLVVCTLLLCFVNQLSALILWTGMFAGLLVVSAALLYSLKRMPCVRFVEDEIARFNVLDADRGVRWKSVRDDNLVLYTLRFNRQTAQVPWRIGIFYPTSESNEPHVEFLPAYEASPISPVETALSIDLNLLGKAPSYATEAAARIDSAFASARPMAETLPSRAPTYKSQSSLV